MAIKVLDDLRNAVPDNFSRTLLDGAVNVLASDNPIRAHLFATAIRELLGHILQTKAPDDAVKAAPWYIGEENRPTRRQRATFAIQGGMPNELVDQLGLDASDMQKDLTDAVEKLNKRTHVREGEVLQDPVEIEAFTSQAGSAVLEFLSTIDEMRSIVADAVIHTESNEVFSKFLEETVDDIDILSTHTQVEGVQVDHVEVSQIGVDTIQYRAQGTVYVQLVCGSGSDHEKGDGTIIADSFRSHASYRAASPIYLKLWTSPICKSIRAPGSNG
jgi:hypothetical protein